MGAKEERTKKKKDFLLVSLDEVGKHNTEEDGWVVISGGVYDITKFLKFHPGGKDIILPQLGKDATEVFVSDEVHSHSTKAFKILSNYEVGRISDYGSYKPIKSDPILSLVDLSKPLLPQVVSMEPTKYQQWLHESNVTSKLRIFDSEFMEFFSRWPWWIIFPMVTPFFLLRQWLPVIVYFFGACLYSTRSPLLTLFGFVVGLFLWSLVEYTLHRFFFHLETKSMIGNYYHLFAHGIHHLTPLDTTRLTFPPYFSLGLAVLVYSALIKLQPIFPAVQASFSGIVFGYMCYDALHFYFHHGNSFMWWGYIQRMKTRHLRHHYKNSNRNFGVTSPLFDIVFGTYE